MREGRIETFGAVIRGVVAAHSQGAPLVANGGSDYIFLIDMGGLRIVHFGDLGHDHLMPGKVKTIGHVDVAITQFDNSLSTMNVSNKKGFKQMNSPH